MDLYGTSHLLRGVNRRRLLQLTCSATPALLAGCLYDGPSEAGGETQPRHGDVDARPSAVVEWGFETDVETGASAGDDPVVSVHRDADAVTVEGVGWYGSSHCGYLCAVPPVYDEETAALSVEVVDEIDEERGGEAGCADDAAADSYRVEVRFDQGVPRRIEAAHPWGHRTVAESG